MLESISWQHFLSTTTLLLTIYYGVASLLLYRKEIVELLTGNKRSPTEVSKPDTNRSLLGKVRVEKSPNTKPTTVSTEEISFQPLAEPEEMPVSPIQDDTLLIGPIADLLQETKALSKMVDNKKREEIISLYKSLLTRYPNLVATRHQQAINIHISTQLKEQNVDFQPNEVNTWWSSLLQSTKTNK